MKKHTVLVLAKPSKTRTMLVQRLESIGCTVLALDPRYDYPDPSSIEGQHRHLFEGVSTLLTPGRFEPPGAEVPVWLSSYLQAKTAVGKVNISGRQLYRGGDAKLISTLEKKGFDRDSWAIPLALTAKSMFNFLRGTAHDNRPETKAKIKENNAKQQAKENSDPVLKRARNDGKNEAKRRRAAQALFTAIQAAKRASTLPPYLLDAPNSTILVDRWSDLVKQLFTWKQPLADGSTFADCMARACAGKQGVSFALGTLNKARFKTQVQEIRSIYAGAGKPLHIMPINASKLKGGVTGATAADSQPSEDVRGLVTWSAPRYLELDSDPALHVPGAQAEGGITPARANEVAATDSSMILACGCKEVGYELARFLEKGFLHGHAGQVRANGHNPGDGGLRVQATEKNGGVGGKPNMELMHCAFVTFFTRNQQPCLITDLVQWVPGKTLKGQHQQQQNSEKRRRRYAGRRQQQQQQREEESEQEEVESEEEEEESDYDSLF